LLHNYDLDQGKEEEKMRRVTLVLAAMALMVSLFAAVAYAATIEGTRQSDIITETNRNDTIFGRGGADDIHADAFGPQQESDADRDVANGNAGNDEINVDDGDGRDTANGGNGNDDTCVIDAIDPPPISCENVEVDPEL
jgi:Ca2+-binding RTX toxin-like protein